MITLKLLDNCYVDTIVQWYRSGKYKEFFRGWPNQLEFPNVTTLYQLDPNSIFIGIFDNHCIRGLITLGQINPKVKSVVWGLMVQEGDYKRSALAIPAAKQLLHYLFKEQNYNKLYSYTLAKDQHIVRLLEMYGFTREAILREHCYFDGQLHTEYIYSILKSEYKE